MTSASGGRPGWWTALLCCLSAAVLVPALFAAAPARAQPPSAVTVSLTELTPTVATSDKDTVIIKGVATNATDRPLTRLQALLWRNQAPYTDREQFEQVLQTEPTEPVGARVTDHASGFIDLTRSDLRPDLPESLAPGASVPFSVQVTVAQLGLPLPDALYMVGVHVRGSTDGGEVSTLGRGRTFLPVVSKQATNKAPLTSVVVLNSRPSYTTEGGFVDDHLADELADGGRLDVLLDSAARKKVNWAVDPELVQALEVMSKGYRVSSGQGTRAGTGAAAAERWLSRFDDLDEKAGYRLIFGSPDLAALARRDTGSYLSRAVRAGRTVTRTAELPTLAMPTEGLADANTLARTDRIDPDLYLLSDASTGTNAVRRSAAGTPVISFDAGAFAGGPDPDPLAPVKVRQRLVSDDWLRTTTGESSVRVITTADQAERDRTADGPHLVRRLLAEAVDQVGADTEQVTLTYPTQAAADELTPRQVDRVEALRRDYVALADLLVAQGDIEQQIDAAVGRAASGAWRRDEQGQAALLAPAMQKVAGIGNGEAVTLGRDRKVVLTGSIGSFPLTITNNLTVPVQVKVNVASGNNSRLKVKSIDRVEVQPGERMSVQVEAKPAANGEVEVSAQLSTLSDIKLGKPATTTVQATEYGTVGWVIAIGAGIAFFVTTALRIRQVRRERGTGGEASAGGTGSDDRDSLTSSAPAAEVGNEDHG
ncbi:MAG: DUF6049 family protein [Propionibacteriales bacterium]|nr:DUF6049 family protein [Propionibacteriales bacterium]